MGLWTYRAQCLRVLDGDTLRLLVDTGFYQRAQIDLRLSGVYTPELGEPGGAECRDFVSEWIDKIGRGDWPLVIDVSVTAAGDPRRTFTRYIGTVRTRSASIWLNAAVRTFVESHPEWGRGVTHPGR